MQAMGIEIPSSGCARPPSGVARSAQPVRSQLRMLLQP